MYWILTCFSITNFFVLFRSWTILGVIETQQLLQGLRVIVMLRTNYLASCHQLCEPSSLKCEAHCVASLIHEPDLHRARKAGQRQGGVRGGWGVQWDDWLNAQLTTELAGRQAVAQRPKAHVTYCQGTGFMQWRLAGAQLFHTGYSSNRSILLKQQPADVSPEVVLCGCRLSLRQSVCSGVWGVVSLLYLLSGLCILGFLLPKGK